MPAIVELRLRPSRPFDPTTRQLHGLACALFEGAYSPDHTGHDKQFTIWPLSPADGGWLLRAAWLADGLPQTVLAACGQLRLGPVTCTVTDLAFRPVAHADLAAGPPADRVRAEFHSPTYFSQNGARVVLPDPRLIVGSWRRRWNASLPEGDDLMISDEDWRGRPDTVTLTGFDLRTQGRDTGHGRGQSGFMGTATLQLDHGVEAGVRRQFGALARFAELSGTGAQTTHGFGATRVAVLRESMPARADANSAGLADSRVRSGADG
jgi:hypothetical protein